MNDKLPFKMKSIPSIITALLMCSTAGHVTAAQHLLYTNEPALPIRPVTVTEFDVHQDVNSNKELWGSPQKKQIIISNDGITKNKTALTNAGENSIKNVDIISDFDAGTGMELFSKKAVTTADSINIKMNGENARGIFGNFAGDSSITNAIVSMNGDSSTGVLLNHADGSTATFTIDNTNLTTSGKNSSGIISQIFPNSQNKGNVNLNIENSKIDLKGENDEPNKSWGILVQARENTPTIAKVTNTAIHSHGKYSKGVEINGRSGKIITEFNKASILIDGDESFGLFMYGNKDGEAQQIKNSVIEMKGASSAGIYLDDVNTYIDNTSITTDGFNSNGIIGESGIINVKNSQITTNGNGSYGFRASNGTTGTLEHVDVFTNGNIDLSKGTSAPVGIVSETGSSLNVSSSKIHTKGESGIGILAQDNTFLSDDKRRTEIDVSNSHIQTNGDEAFGVEACLSHGSTDLCTNTVNSATTKQDKNNKDITLFLTKDIISTKGKDAYGLYAKGGANLYSTDSQVFTSGENAHGVAVKDGSSITLTNSTVNTSGVHADGLYINNGVIVTNNSQITSQKGVGVTFDNAGVLNLNNKSILNGSVVTKQNALSNVNISDSTWNSTGNSNITNLKADNSNINFKKNGNKFTTTSVDNLSGNNGAYIFAVDVVNKNGSKLIINKSSNGTHIARALNDGSQNTTGYEKVILIEDKSGANAKAVFNADKDVELGGYSYRVQRDPDNPNNWILAEKNGQYRKPTPNDTAKTITGLASTSYLMNQAEISTLRQRTSALNAGPVDVSGAWGRMYGGNYKTRNNDNLAKVNMNYYGFQLGGDVNTLHNSNNKNFLGLYVGHTTGKPDYLHGDATATSWYSGIYDTFIADNGFYVDSLVKFGRYRNRYNLKDSQDNSLNGKAQSNVITLSSQVGKRFTLTENDSYNVYTEPQAQLTYSRIGAFNTTASNGLRVKQKAYNSTVARLGVLLGTQLNKQSDIYLKTSYLHEFSKDVNYSLNNSRESYSVKGNGLEAGLGMNVKLNANSNLYAEGNYINSKTHYTGSKFNIGYHFSF